MTHDGPAQLDFFASTGAWLGSAHQYLCGCNYANETFSAYFPHLAYFCPECGDIWARGVYTYEFQYRPIPADPWRSIARRCERHGDGLLINSDSLHTFSMELLLREFHILAKYYEGGI